MLKGLQASLEGGLDLDLLTLVDFNEVVTVISDILEEYSVDGGAVEGLQGH